MTNQSYLPAHCIFTLTPNIIQISCPVGRPGGNRTPNLRFWRPPLCQLSYWPILIFVSVRDVQCLVLCSLPTGEQIRNAGKSRDRLAPVLRMSLFKRRLSGNCYSIILVTTPAPTVRPPSRMANRTPSSIAIGEIKSTTIRMLSPGITISEPSGNSTAPVTSVVRK